MAYREEDYHQLPEERTEEVTIFVNNLPDELNEDGIAQLFKSYGEICSLLSPPGAKYAFVGYKTYREAEHAIRALNDRSPLYLKVALSKKKPHNKRNNRYAPPIEVPMNADFQARDPRYVSNGINHYSVPRKTVPHMPQYPSFSHGVAEVHHSDYPYDFDPTMYNPYENVGRYADTNAMWSRGCVSIDEYGKRFVSMGRGYTYHIPEPHPKIEEFLGRVYEKRRAYGEDRIQSDIGKCQYCTTLTRVRCEKCSGFYCSQECQITDWPRHKMECRTIPFHSGLVGYPETTTLSRSSSDEQLLVPRKPGRMDLGSLGALRRPKRALQLENEKNAEAANKPEHSNSLVLGEAAPLQDRVVSSHSKEAKNDVNAKTNGVAAAARQAILQQNHAEQISNGNYQEMPKKKDDTDGIAPDKRNGQNNHNSNPHAKPASGAAPEQQRDVQRQLRENRGGENYNFQYGRGCSDTSSGPRERRKDSRAGSMLDLAKVDLVKIEQELAFQRDPRAQANVDKQIPVEPIEILPPARENVATNVAPAPLATPAAAPVLSRDEFTRVIVVVDMSDSTFWVQRVNDALALGEMMTKLNEKAGNYPKATELVLGEIYAVEYDNFWHRATVVSTNPSEIFYVDFGNSEPPQNIDFRSLKDFPNYPPFAVRIRLPGSSKARNEETKVDGTLWVRMINVDKDGVVEVEVRHSAPEATTAAPVAAQVAPVPEVAEIPQSVAAPKAPEVPVAPAAPKAPEVPVPAAPEVAKVPKQPEVKLPSLLDTLQVNSQAFIQIYVALDDKSCAVCVLGNDFQEEFQMIYEHLTVDCEKAVKPANFRPQVGDFVCGQREGYWLRGYVLSLGPPARLILVDEARISAVEEMLPIPEKYTKICTFGSICTFENLQTPVNADEHAQFRVTGIKDVAGERVVSAILLEPERLKNVSVTLKNWKPTPEQKGVAAADLKPNTEVCLTAYISERIMYVRGLDVETLERTQRVIQDVAKWAQIAPMFDAPPAPGQFVIAKYADGNFYRAVVTKIIDGTISVSYIDYGNREVTTIDQLRLLSDELKEQRSCAAKVLLKDVKTDVLPTKEVHDYLDVLVGTEQPLFCTFAGIPSKDGVILTTATGECVNTRVNELITPSYEREDPNKNIKCFTLDDFKFAKLGDVGKVAKAIVLHATEPPFKYVLSPVDPEVIRHVTEEMALKVREYCEATKEHYIPRVGELCLAVYFDQWYRGVCLNRSETPDHALIQFIDYGNVEVVAHANIRIIAQEFFDAPGLGCTCTVKNLGVPSVNGQVPANIKARLDVLIQPESFIDVLITKHEDGDYDIELPEVKKTLIAEGLIQP